MVKTSFFIGIVLLLSAGLLLAQQTPEATPEAFDCSTLVSVQETLSARLESFAADMETNPDEALKNMYEVGKEYQNLALVCGYIPADIEKMVINTTDTERIMSVLSTITGDPLRGQILYNGQENTAGGIPVGCAGCHDGGKTGPTTEGTWTRWDEVHSQEPQFAGYTFEQYAVESIIHPWDYTVEGYQEGIMPNFYQTQLSYQDLADIVAYLSSQDQLIEEN